MKSVKVLTLVFITSLFYTNNHAWAVWKGSAKKAPKKTLSKEEESDEDEDQNEEEESSEEVEQEEESPKKKIKKKVKDEEKEKFTLPLSIDITLIDSPTFTIGEQSIEEYDDEKASYVGFPLVHLNGKLDVLYKKKHLYKFMSTYKIQSFKDRDLSTYTLKNSSQNLLSYYAGYQYCIDFGEGSVVCPGLLYSHQSFGVYKFVNNTTLTQIQTSANYISLVFDLDFRFKISENSKRDTRILNRIIYGYDIGVLNSGIVSSKATSSASLQNFSINSEFLFPMGSWMNIHFGGGLNYYKSKVQTNAEDIWNWSELNYLVSLGMSFNIDFSK